MTFIPWPVIEGFTLGIAAIIFLQQVPAAFGGTAPAGQRPLSAAWNVVARRRLTIAAATLLVWLVFVAALMVGLPRLHRAIPESLTAVVAATVLVVVAGLPVARIGALPSHLPAPVCRMPIWTPCAPCWGRLWPSRRWRPSSRCCRPGSRPRCLPTGPYDPNRELVGQGLARSPPGCSAGCPPPGPSPAPR